MTCDFGPTVYSQKTELDSSISFKISPFTFSVLSAFATFYILLCGGQRKGRDGRKKDGWKDRSMCGEVRRMGGGMEGRGYIR